MARPPRKLYKIGEVMEHTGLSRQTLHNYTLLGLLPVAGRTKANHRLYDERVFEIIERIAELKKDHTLEQIKGLLEGEAKASRKGSSGGQDPSGSGAPSA